MIEKLKWNYESAYSYYLADSIPSTNTYLKNNGDFYPDKTVLIALEQTEGRGRYNRVWKSNSDIIFSILLKRNGPYAISTPLAIVLALEEFGFDTNIKWPNDIYYNGLKLSGILIEDVYKEQFQFSVIGIGINLSDKEEVNGIGLNTDISSYSIIQKITEKFDILNSISMEEVIKLYRNKSMVLGKDVSYHDSIYKAIHVDDMGYLVLQNDKETLRISSDEINIKEALQ